MSDLFANPHISAALYFTNQGHYIFKYKDEHMGVSSKALRTKEVAAAFTLQDSDSGWIPSGVMRTGHNAMGDWFIFFAKPLLVDIRFTKEKAITIPAPATVLLGMNDDYYLFAMGEEDFNPKGKVYSAPFPNVHTDGRICWGSNQKPKVHHSSASQAWDLFFKSAFNGDLADHKCKKNPQDVREFLKGLSGESRFPVSAMYVCYETLEGLIDQYRKGRK